MAPGQYVLLRVSDTGSGIAPEVLPRVFEPFFTTKEVGKGSGLGLSMVYGFVKQSGGHIRLYSQVGQGTSVTLYFPRSRQEFTAEPESLMRQQFKGGDELILVVEDDELVRRHLTGLLRELGYRVIEAASGRHAIDVLAANPQITLLFTDVVMPEGMDGEELAKRALKMCPGLKVLFTSGYTENAVVRDGRLDSGIELLNKPYNCEQLAAKLRKVLGE